MSQRLKTNSILVIAFVVILCLAAAVSQRGDGVDAPVSGGVAVGGATATRTIVPTTRPDPTDTPAAIPTPRSTDTPEPTATEGFTPAPLPTRTLAQDLAIINDTPGNPTFIRRVNELLVELDAGFPENQREIGDLTAQAHAVLIDKGRPVGIIEIMEEMLKLVGAAQGLTYKDAITGWLLLMTP